MKGWTSSATTLGLAWCLNDARVVLRGPKTANKISPPALNKLGHQGTLFSFVQFWWACAHCSLKFPVLSWQTRQVAWSSAAVSASRVNMLCIQRCSSTNLGCCKWPTSVAILKAVWPLASWYRDSYWRPDWVPLTCTTDIAQPFHFYHCIYLFWSGLNVENTETCLRWQKEDFY